MYDDTSVMTSKFRQGYRPTACDFRQAERRQAEERGHKEGVAEERERMRREAIKAGVAEYVIVDPLTGRAEFRWKRI